MSEARRCARCGRDLPTVGAAITTDGRVYPLCHPSDAHDAFTCYHLVTVYHAWYDPEAGFAFDGNSWNGWEGLIPPSDHLQTLLKAIRRFDGLPVNSEAQHDAWDDLISEADRIEYD